MKFGEHMHVQSDRPWCYHNLDYDAVKRLIKQHTTPGEGKPVAIPGHDNAFENDLLNLLKEQIKHISDFSDIKLREIQGSFAKAEKKVSTYVQTQSRYRDVTSSEHLVRLDRYARLEEAVMATSHKLNSLVKFVSLNETAIQKLLKKYFKWTSSPRLKTRLQNEVLADPKCFVNIQVAEAFDTMRELRNNLRILYQKQVDHNAVYRSPSPSSIESSPPSPPPEHSSGSDASNVSGASLTPATTVVDSTEDLTRPWLKRINSASRLKRPRDATHPGDERTPLLQQRQPPPKPKMGYWNEYDNPEDSDGGGDDAYVIYVDPNEVTCFDSLTAFTRRLFRCG